MWLATASRSPSRSARGSMPGDLAEHRVAERPARREHPHELLRVGRQLLDPQRERVGQARRHGAAAVDARGEELLREQRVALAAGEEPVDQRRVGLRAEDALELRHELVPREPAEVDAQRAVRSRSASSGRSGWRRCSSSGR